MRKVLTIGLIVGGIAWYGGWKPQAVDVPALVSERAGCDTSYPTVCVAPPPPFLACEDIRSRNFRVFGDDPHGFDTDRDGVGCKL